MNRIILLGCKNENSNIDKQDIILVPQKIPRFKVTIFLNPHIISNSIPTTFIDLSYFG